MKKLEKQTLASNKLRLFSIFIAVFLIPMLLMCIMNLWAVHNDTINTASQFTGQLLQQNSTTIDNVLRLIDGSFSQLFMNGDVLDFFQATSLPSTFDEYKGIADIFSEMRSVLDRGNGYVSNIYLYNENTDVLLTSRQSMKYETKLNEKPFFDSFIEEPGFHVGSYKINGREEAYIIASRVVYSHMMRSGIILVELNRDRLHQLLDQMSTNNSGSILIIDDEGNMVVPNETIRSSQIIETIAAPNHSRIQMNLNDEEYLIYTQKSSINFWTYIWMVPCSSFAVMTEFCDTLVRSEHISYFEAHHVAYALVDACTEKGIGVRDVPEKLIAETYENVLGKKLTCPESEIHMALDARHFVAIRNVEGGPAPKPMAQVIERAAKHLREHEKWLQDNQKHLQASDAKLQKAFASI